MLLATLYVLPPSVPRLSVAGLMGSLAAVRKARKNPSLFCAIPATCPEPLILHATLKQPPKVPSSSVVGLIGLFGAVRKARRAGLVPFPVGQVSRPFSE